MSECIRVQPPPVDFDTKQLFQPDIAEMDLPAKMIEQGKLAWLVRSFKHYRLETEHRRELVCVCGIQVSVLIKESDSPGALSCFDHQLDRTGIEPLLTLVDPCGKGAVIEPSIMLLAKFHLDVETAAPCCSDNFTRVEFAFRESLAAFDSIDAEVCTQIQISRKFSLGYGNFKRSSTGNGRDAIHAGQIDFSPGRALVRNHPARHGNLEYRYQMRALLQVTSNSRGIVTWIERTSGGRDFRNSDSFQIIRCVNGTDILHFLFSSRRAIHPTVRIATSIPYLQNHSRTQHIAQLQQVLTSGNQENCWGRIQ